MEHNLNEINKEKDGIIKIISWVYTVQDKVEWAFKALLHCGTTSGLWHKPKDNCIQYKLKNKNFTLISVSINKKYHI